MKENKIVMLSTSVLHPHPDNPRKDLGDLTELAESIAQSGVMQNLTVVPHKDIEGEYTVVIGHRRLGASKLAGLDVVPCVIVEMSDKDQLATMMLENMQRSDLTIIEQADGFQLMMDFGETVDSIAEKTGISKTTVRNRLKLTRYDKELLKKTSAYQPTMEQYLKLSEIEDVNVANDCLRFIGTKNFDNEVGKAIKLQEEKKAREEVRAFLNERAEKLADASYNAIQERKLKSVSSIYLPFTDMHKKSIIANKEKYSVIYWSEGYGFTVYRDHCAEDDVKTYEIDEKRKKRQDLEMRADALYDNLIERAGDFVKSYKTKKGDFEKILSHLFKIKVRGESGFQGNSHYSISTALGFELPEGMKSWEEEARGLMQDYILDSFDEDGAKTALVYMWVCQSARKPHALHYNVSKLALVSHSLADMFLLLEDLGYNVADEEWEYLDGRHPIFSEEAPI